MQLSLVFFFKKFYHGNNALYEVDLAKTQIEHIESIINRFFTLQNPKLWMMELYYNFFTKFCAVNKFEELEMDTYLLYFTLAEKELKDYIQPEMKTE